MRSRTEKAYGPYRRGHLWRVVECSATGARSTCSFTSEAKAIAYIAKFNDTTQGRTISSVIDEYLKARTDLRSSSLETLDYRLHGILRDVERDRPITEITPRVAADLYARRVTERRPDTHQAELGAASALFEWCVKQGWIADNPFADVEAVGRKNVRKAKLRIEESRRFLDAALGENTQGGLAAAIALLMGLRATEVTRIRCRDIDDGGRVLWVDETDGNPELKNDDSERHLGIPAVLRVRILKLRGKRPAESPLFGDVDRHWLYNHVTRISAACGVPVSPHALRRSHSKISAETVSIDHVARALGHGGTAITKRHYVGRGTEERRAAGVVLKVIAGGRR